ncbi:MAG: inositol monophosphatase family protein [Actinomycetota bacterium]
MIGTAPTVTPAQHLEHVAGEVVRLAATYVATNIGVARAAGTKSSPTDVVTHTDLDSERLIRTELLRRCPGSAVEGEELDDEGGENGIRWIVDPIDGTVNFLYDLPVVAVSIAASVGGVVVAGAVADVLRGEVFSANDDGPARLDGRPLTVSDEAVLANALIGTGFSYDAERRRRQAETLARLLPRCRDIRCMGSAALNLCWVAAGRLDAYFEQDTKLYDYAAGNLIAARAGAVVEAPQDNDLSLDIAAAPGLFPTLRHLVGPAH